MVLLDKMWDDVIAGPSPDKGLGKLRKVTTKPLVIKENAGESSGSKYQKSLSMPPTPVTPGTPVTPTTPSTVPKQNVWRSVFHPGSNLNTKNLGADIFDSPKPNSPTVYDCRGCEKSQIKVPVVICINHFCSGRSKLYSGETRTRSNHR